MDTTFTARPQFLGIIYQIVRYPLYLALKHANDANCELFVERYDDIEIGDNSDIVNALQIKHVSTRLTNRSSQLWKTLRVWSENYRSGLVRLPGSILTLVTTVEASAGSIAAYLRADGRDTEKAFRLLTNEMVNVNTSLQAEFEAFGKLSDLEQRQLVEAIWVIDRVPSIDDIPHKIKEMCIGVLPENRNDLYESLEGWWLGQVVNHMRNGSITPITTQSVSTAIAKINDSLRDRQLTDPFLDYPLPDGYDWDSRTFVRQLRLIDFNTPLIVLAERDYFRAKKLRDYLVDELYLNKLTSYDQRLIEQWELRFYGIVDQKCAEITDEAVLQGLGKSICNSVLKEVLIPVHQRLPDSTEYMTRGSYHILADDEKNMRVGWHPHFKKRLKPGD